MEALLVLVWLLVTKAVTIGLLLLIARVIRGMYTRLEGGVWEKDIIYSTSWSPFPRGKEGEPEEYVLFRQEEAESGVSIKTVKYLGVSNGYRMYEVLTQHQILKYRPPAWVQKIEKIKQTLFNYWRSYF
jgi:hypothetical protein